MAKFWLVIFASFAAISIASGADYNYIKGSAIGPENWGGVCQSGQKQSPIDIDTSTAKYDSALGDIYVSNYDTIPSENFTIANTNHSLKVSFPPNIFYVSGGGLPGTFTTVQFHLHWGSDNNKGAEHTVNEMQYPAEIHFVSVNVKYPDITLALPESDGLAVLGVFLEVGADNSAYEDLLGDISDLNAGGTKKKIAPFMLKPLLAANMKDYYRYPGSLTTPPCSEAVTWTVFNDTVKIPQRLLTNLRALKMGDNSPMVNNYRPVQPLHDRTVKSSFMHTRIVTDDESTVKPSSTSTKAKDTVDDGIAVKVSNVVLMLMLFGVLFLM
ncbi:carbonic anhydrase 2-like [Montipora foliosa]|uniref:carbonic anhydrase 2-like n=1 Tax=Montipora foliosa TaxID=591990 RepID=UPI0035F16764